MGGTCESMKVSPLGSADLRLSGADSKFWDGSGLQGRLSLTRFAQLYSYWYQKSQHTSKKLLRVSSRVGQIRVKLGGRAWVGNRSCCRSAGGEGAVLDG